MGTFQTPTGATGEPPGTGQPRRHLLRTLLGVTLGAAVPTGLAGCDLIRGDEPAPVPPVDPLTPLRDEALRLAGAYDEAIVAQPELAGRLTPIAEAHRAHAAELGRILQPPAPPIVAPSAPPSATPATGDDDAVLGALRTAEQRARRTAAAACQQAPVERAALLGSIAAARASHAEALR